MDSCARQLRTVLEAFLKADCEELVAIASTREIQLLRNQLVALKGACDHELLKARISETWSGQRQHCLPRLAVAHDELVLQSINFCGVEDLCALRSSSKQWHDYANTDELWRSLAVSRWRSTLVLHEKDILQRFSGVFSRFGRLKHTCMIAGGGSTAVEPSQYAFLVDIFAGVTPIINGLFGLEYYHSNFDDGLRVVCPHGAARLPLDIDECASLRATVVLMRLSDYKQLCLFYDAPVVDGNEEYFLFESGRSFRSAALCEFIGEDLRPMLPFENPTLDLEDLTDVGDILVTFWDPRPSADSKMPPEDALKLLHDQVDWI